MSETTDADGRAEVTLHDGPLDADEWAVVVASHPDDDPTGYYSLSLGGGPVGEGPPADGEAARFAAPVSEAARERFDVDRFGHRHPVGVAWLDTDGDEAMVAWMGDVIAFTADDTSDGQAGEDVCGGIAIIGRSGVMRVRGIGAVDVDPEQVIEVVERGGG